MIENKFLQIQSQLDVLSAGEGSLGVIQTMPVIFILLNLAGVTLLFLY